MAKTANKPADLRGKSIDELASLVLDLRKAQFNMRFQRATGQLEGTGQIRAIRRDIARAKTILAEKQRSAAKG
jgi:large subunit ribosomal protein L29